ncbi:MAG: phage Gp37/Gp68 family protein [Acidobacteriia bacterium]|nr:phage Gp37/Gp68 family protein [Terriglobia bacterium]
MATSSHIEWTDATWNPVTGCSKISPGCKFCYAERLARRLQAMGQENYRKGFDVTLQPHMLDHPLRWRLPRRVFVNSMSDLFHLDVPTAYITTIFDVMRRANWHQYQILTKRSDRLLELNPLLKWQPQIWMGVSVENEDYLYRVDHLRETGARIKFLSIEPLLGQLTKLNLRGIDWVIVGGESGPGARPMKPEWVREVRDRCIHARVPFFFKQWGGVFKSKTGRALDGRTWDEMPVRAPEPTKLSVGKEQLVVLA